MPDITSYVTATIASQRKGIQDALIERNEALRMLKKKGKIKYGLGGDSIKWRVKNTVGSNFGSTTDWAARSFSTQQPFTVMEVRWCQYDGGITLNDFQLMRNKNAGPEAKMFDQLKEELNSFKQDVMERIGKHVYASTALTGDNGTNISAFGDVIDATSAYAGTAASGNTWWQSQTASVSNAEQDTDGNDVPELLEGMRSLFLDCCGGGQSGEGISPDLATSKEEPDFAVTTKAIYLNYQNCLHPQMRYTSKEAKDPQSELLFAGLPVMWDTYCTSGKMFMINSKFIEFDCCTDTLVEFPERLQAVPVVDRNASVWKGLAQCQMVYKQRRYHGVLTVS